MAKARSSSQANSAEESHSHITDQMEPALDSQNVSLNENISSPKGPTTRSIVAWDAAIACKNDSTVNMSNSEDGVRSSCPVDSATGNTSDQQVLSPADGHEKGLSMKHLTCFFWWENGHCKYSEDHCLYSHTDTGRVADAPTQIEPGAPAVAGTNAKVQDPVYVNWRGHHGLQAGRKRKTSEYHPRSGISPAIQQQLLHINAKAQYNEKHNLWPLHPQGNPGFGQGQPLGVTSPPYETPLTPYQPPPGIFSPTPPYSYNEHLSNPAHYHLPHPPEANPATQHGSCEQMYAELQSKLQKSEHENKFLRDLVEKLGDALISSADAEQQTAIAIQNIFGATGISLLRIHKKLDDSSLRSHPDLKTARDEILKIGKELVTYMSKHRSHLDDVENMRVGVRRQLVRSEED